MKKWKHLIRGEFEGYQNCLDEERAVRRDLDDKDWWYWRLLQQTNKQTNSTKPQNVLFLVLLHVEILELHVNNSKRRRTL